MSKISIIRTELDSNPGLYSALTDQQAADELNNVDKISNRTSMSRSEIYENIEGSALASLTSLQLDQINLSMSDVVNPFGNIVSVFTNIFSPGSATLTALAAARRETISRAKQLGINFVHTINVTNARNL